MTYNQKKKQAQIKYNIVKLGVDISRSANDNTYV